MIDVAIFHRVPKNPNNPGNGYRHGGGLGANCEHTGEVLTRMGARVWISAVYDLAGVARCLAIQPAKVAVLEAIWATAADYEALARSVPQTKFVVRSHSKTGFLQVEWPAITAIRGVISSAADNLNFATNNYEFAQALNAAYGPCLYLPNLYDLASSPRRGPGDARLRACSFGASRLLKMHPSAALAALQAARSLGRPLDFFMNVDRTPGGEGVRQTVHALLDGVDGVTVTEVPWQEPAEFRRTVATMDLALCLSATETFCLVAADSVAAGVPTVTGPAVCWMPTAWRAPIDLTTMVADAAVDAVSGGHHTARQQLRGLEHHLREAEAVWANFLSL